jgi:hypothetical protein
MLPMLEVPAPLPPPLLLLKLLLLLLGALLLLRPAGAFGA